MSRIHRDTLTKRDFIKLGAVCAISYLTKGCVPSNDGPTTGVSGLNTVDQFVNNAKISSAARAAESLGLVFSFYRTVGAPDVTGTYAISGQNWRYEGGQFIGPNSLAQGSWAFSNQTEDGYIEMDYSQTIGQTGAGPGRIIICGRDNGFTVYAALNISTFSLDCLSAVTIDGHREPSGNLNVSYLNVPVRDPYGVYLVTVGRMTLTKGSGALKQILGGAGFLMHRLQTPE